MFFRLHVTVLLVQLIFGGNDGEAEDQPAAELPELFHSTVEILRVEEPNVPVADRHPGAKYAGLLKLLALSPQCCAATYVCNMPVLFVWLIYKQDPEQLH